ncbi:hypothetical protein NVV94_10120 [Pseudomonas sp. LS1212]|uniref:NEL-type E3 ubiquitin ligase domain-containing protein n=1 Tax=Pseudomonas sp. LS1212 TaxID=2972478 RepID=UPI00215D5D13|nr:NEL-type E3 ubiquitin ligase domain-containing protein [Pseudomonas sp. LS1212]UVJ45862.1 hypothetical protein NVV94_10120 [Pseudomonas sp. LS1212]
MAQDTQSREAAGEHSVTQRTPVEAGLHGRFSQQRIPAWLVGATTDQRLQLQKAIVQSQRHKRVVRGLLSDWQGLQRFAEPLLSAALEESFGLKIDVTRSFFFHVVRGSRALSSRPGAVLATSRQTLLQAALQNFVEQEPFDYGTALLQADDQPIDIAPEAFARVCRNLDLGQRYQEHLQSVFLPSGSPGITDQVAQGNLRGDMMTCQRYALLAEAELALLKGDIDAASHAAVGAGLQFRGDRYYKTCRLTIWGLLLDELILFEVLQPAPSGIQSCLVYIPDDPDGAFKQYASRAAFMQALRGKLRNRSYQRFFRRFVSQRNLAAYNHKIDSLFNAHTVTHREGVRALDSSRARLDLVAQEVTGNLFRQCFDQHLRRIRDDARVLAVPTAEVDAVARRERLQGWLAAGFDVLNLAALFVPVLGIIMMPVAGAQLMSELFHGVEAWEESETDQALGYLMGVAENLALIGALGFAHGSVNPPASKGVSFVDRLVPVRLPDGSSRLWNSDLSVYEVSAPNLDALQPNQLGQYEHAGRRFIRLEQRTLEVRPDGEPGKWRVTAPDDPQRYSPLATHNGMGSWWIEGENPRGWDVSRLIQRLRPGLSQVPDADLLALVRVSAVSEARLRSVYSRGLPVPALLLDAIEGYRIDRGLADLGLAFALKPQGKLLIRDFPGLSANCANELLGMSRASERARMLRTGRVPLRMAEAARWYLQQSRLNQALLGLEFETMANADSAVLQAKAAPGQRLFDDRAQAAMLLDMRPIKPRIQALQRLSQGRFGYPLGGVVGRLLPNPDGRLQALFPGLDAAQLADFRAALQQSRVPLATQITRLEEQWRSLEASLATWSEQEGPYGVHRRLFADQLQDCWQRRVHPGSRAYTYEGYRLAISELDVGELPAIGDGFEHVTELALSDMQLTEGTEAFLRRFTGLRALVISRGGLTRLPEAVRAMPQLRELLLPDNHIQALGTDLGLLSGARWLQVLDLSGNGLAINLEALEQLASLRQLRSLNLAGNDSLFPAGSLGCIAQLSSLRRLYLSGNWITFFAGDIRLLADMTELEILSMSDNPLGQAPDVSNLSRLTQLNLQNTGLTGWPTGLGQLQNLQSVNLSFNRLQILPDGLANLWRFNLDGNPLSTEAAAAFAEGGGVYRTGSTASEASTLAETDMTRWYDGATAEQRSRWEELQEQPGAQPFFRVLQRLADSAEHDPGNRASQQRVWRLLDAAADSQGLRERLFALARGEETCADRAALLFSQLEVELRVYQLDLQDLPIERKRVPMAALARQLFRLDEVDIAARKFINRWRRAAPDQEIDEIEVLLAFRVRLAARLGLPDQPTEALYLDLADQVTDQVLTETAEMIEHKEQTLALKQWMVAQDFWVEFLKSGYPLEFEQAAQPGHLGLDYLDACLDPANPLPEVSEAVLSELADPLQVTLDVMRIEGRVQRVEIDDYRYLKAIDTLNRLQQQAEADLLERLTDGALKLPGSKQSSPVNSHT